MNGNRSDPSSPTDRPAQPRRLRPSGGYRSLHSFQLTTVIYDATVAFCERFVDKRSRTHDQMVQAARSGRQNIAEGSRASAASSQTELRLVNVARASLDELLLDFEDFLRQRGLSQWAKDSPEALEVRKWHQTDRSDRSNPTDYSRWLASDDPAIVANAVICLINQANYLLDRQVAALERDFVKAGGYSEQLAAARIAERAKQQTYPTNQLAPTDRSDQPLPNCPLCRRPMTLRNARKGLNAGTQFWGCTAFPKCRGTRPLDWLGRPASSDQSVQSDQSDR